MISYNNKLIRLLYKSAWGSIEKQGDRTVWSLKHDKFTMKRPDSQENLINFQYANKRVYQVLL